jgi:glutathione synthase/RimK-type ligase-like ATP-grasp enzyme
MVANRNQPNFVVIGCPENRRIALFQAALQRLGFGEAKVISWLEVIRNRLPFERFVNPETILRIDSAGENFAVERELIALGASGKSKERSGFIDADQARQLAFDRGRILYPHQWFSGFQICLNHLALLLDDDRPNVVMNHPSDIALMFDKPRCHALLHGSGVSVPSSLGEITSYEHLREVMKARHCWRVFIKLAGSSSASGVVAYETNWQREQAWTSVELSQNELEICLYNSLKVRRYCETREIATIIDWLCAEGVHVEEWVPKASFNGCTTDLRVVVIDGQPAHTVVRLSKSPLTNLHLGNRRGDLQNFRQQIGKPAWQRIGQVCRQVAERFPHSLYMGIDIGLTPTLRHAVVFEVNAFGDLLPEVFYQGLDTYEQEILSALARCGNEFQKTSSPW